MLEELKQLVRAAPKCQLDTATTAEFFDRLGVSTQLVMQFLPPETVTVVGAHCLYAIARPSNCVDMALRMPAGCLLAKDHMNNRYLARRALYLCGISRHLSQFQKFRNHQFEFANGDPARPCLLLTPNAKTFPGITIRLFPCLSPTTFALHKLAPDRNNLRWVTKSKASTAGATSQETPNSEPSQAPTTDNTPTPTPGHTPSNIPQATNNDTSADLLPTPSHNARLASDMLCIEHAGWLLSQLQRVLKARDAIILLKVWARRFQLYSYADGLTGDVIATLVANLIAQGKLVAAMTPLQVMRIVLTTLLDPAGLTRGTASAPPGTCQEKLNPPPGLALWRKHHEAVLLDGTGWVNVASHMTKSAVMMVSHTAKHSLATLDSLAVSEPDLAFASLFLTSHTAADLFDYHWRVRGPMTTSERGKSGMAELQSFRAQEREVEALLTRALGDRARLVRALPRQVAVAGRGGGKGAAVLGAAQPASDEIWVGALMDPAQAQRLVDIGPAADDRKAAARFRAFWGDRSELRRFQDGQICEALVWEGPAAARHTIPDRIVQYIVHRHLPEGTEVAGRADALDSVLEGKPPQTLAAQLAAARQLDTAADRLGKTMRGLTSLPLKVVTVQAVSAIARHTTAFTPLPHPFAGGPAAAPGLPVPRCLEPIELQVQLENSGRWPDDPEAHDKVLAAFLLQLGSALEWAAGVVAVPCEKYCDVLYEGFAFRLTLLSGREEAIAARLALAPQPAMAVGAAAAAASAVLSRLELAHHQGLVAHVAGLHPEYAPSCRLASRWVSSHMLSWHLSHEVVELLVAAAFTQPAGTGAAASRVTGLLRFLQLLANFPWAQRPLLVDPANEVSNEGRRLMMDAWEARQAGGGGGCGSFMLATPKDLEGQQWQCRHLTTALLTHLVSLAGRSFDQLAAAIEGRAATGPKQVKKKGGKVAAATSIFHTALQDYDVVIRLRREALPLADRCLPLTQLDTQGSGSGRDAPDELSPVLAQGRGPVPVEARAVLRAFPEKVVMRQGPDRLRSELLIGMDPVRDYLSALTQRYSHLGVFCGDGSALPVVGVKWDPQAFLPSPLKDLTAHTSLTVAATAVRERGEGGLGGLAVVNVVNVLGEMLEMGAGLVDDLELPGLMG